MLSRYALATALLMAALMGCGPVPLAQNCAEWSRLKADEQLQTAHALIDPRLMMSVREKQHLPPDTTDVEVFAAVSSSFTKVCEIERRPGLMLSEIVTRLYC